MTARAAGALLLAAALSACQAVAPAAGPGGGGARGLALVPAAGGLDVAGSGGREIGFGRDQPGVLETVARIDGRAPRPVTCGSGRSAFAAADGLRLVFEGGTFVGWADAAASAGRGCA